ncbi:hypothetical protein CEXT_277691 [Caerostris extrusa]|uniref:Uncharacterized protein n=1 Tax=Caerostris extrusa TaxID=172846 RepID=A0AAV4NG56_CAEEX|nr:hypothetical protein CEXT_277691 [Caerostris extrusa]
MIALIILRSVKMIYLKSILSSYFHWIVATSLNGFSCLLIFLFFSIKRQEIISFHLRKCQGSIIETAEHSRYCLLNVLLHARSKKNGLKCCSMEEGR